MNPEQANLREPEVLNQIRAPWDHRMAGRNALNPSWIFLRRGAPKLIGPTMTGPHWSSLGFGALLKTSPLSASQRMLLWLTVLTWTSLPRMSLHHLDSLQVSSNLPNLLQTWFPLICFVKDIAPSSFTDGLCIALRLHGRHCSPLKFC